MIMTITKDIEVPVEALAERVIAVLEDEFADDDEKFYINELNPSDINRIYARVGEYLMNTYGIFNADGNLKD